MPKFLGLSGMLLSLKASREASSIFFLHYLLINKNRIDQTAFFRTLGFYSYYFLFLATVFSMTGIVPIGYEKSMDRFELFHVTFLSLFLFIKSGLVQDLQDWLFTFVLVILWTFTMRPNDHDAILAVTTVGCLFMLFKSRILLVTIDKWKAVVALLMLICSGYLGAFNRIVDAILQTPSFVSRAIFFAPRIDYVLERPLTGYGFIHKDAVTLVEDSPYMESLSFIDGGYLDILVKYGGFVGLIYLLVILFSVLKYNVRDTYGLSLRIAILAYIPVALTWSVFTYSMGLLCIAMVVFLYEKYEVVQDENN